MRSRKVRKQIILSLVGLLLLCGCGGNANTISGAKGNLADWRQKMPLTESALAQGAKDRINPAQKEVADIMEKYTDLQWVFTLDDFAPEEIACENVLAEYKDGKENPEILGLYEAEGEVPEYLYYAELPEDAWGDNEYIVVYANPEADTWTQGDTCKADIWEYSLNSEKYYKTALPEAGYIVSGTWQDPELFLMMLAHEFDGKNGFCAYTDFETGKMEIFGHAWSFDEDEDYYLRVAAKVLNEAENEGIICTVYQAINGYFTASVKMEISLGNGEVTQVLLTELLRYSLGSPLGNSREEIITIWDGNADGYDDILLYQGYDGGSGGTWQFYEFLVWSEEDQQYKAEYFPSNTGIDFEAHKLYSKGQIGLPHQYYKIYELQNGKYMLSKQLDLIYGWETGEDGEAIDVATAYYSDWTGREEETDITGLDWTETKALLEGKYPEFNFWREG